MANETVLSILRRLQRCHTAGFRRFGWLLSKPLILYSIFWTLFLAAVVTIASVSSELAFSWTLSPSTEYSQACACTAHYENQRPSGHASRNCYRVALDQTGDVLCLPAQLFKKSRLDFTVPPIFAAVIVTASACFVHAVGLWEM